MTDGELARPRVSRVHVAIRLACLIAAAAGVGLLIHRLRRTPEQKELAHYIEAEVPAIRNLETPVLERVARLWQAPGLKPEEARQLIVDDIVPRLLKLRKLVAELKVETQVVRDLNDEYLKVTDRHVDACRACVQVIDDPKLSTQDGFARAKKEFEAVKAAYVEWDKHVAAAARAHRLAKP
jgi:hypothetical protein